MIKDYARHADLWFTGLFISAQKSVNSTDAPKPIVLKFPPFSKGLYRE
jgi:hypothetical protein